MNEENIVVKIKDGDPFNVSKQRLIADSRMFRYLIEELNFDELELDDFSPDVVALFFTLLDDRKLGDVEIAQFRELNKLAVVFEVEWLKKDCRTWLESRIECAKNDEEKMFIFEECLYILRKWELRDMMEALISKLATQDNTSFASQYMSDLDKLDTIQIDLMLKLGGSHSEQFLRTILKNLEGKKELDQNVKYLLKRMNLALCFEHNKELYLQTVDVLEKLSNISVNDIRFILHLSTETTTSVSSRSEKIKTRTTLVIDIEEYCDLMGSCNTIKDTIDAISDNRVTSMFCVVELLLKLFYKNTPNTEDTHIFMTELDYICREKQLQKVSKEHLEMIIYVLKFSPLLQKVQLITLLNEIKDNDKLSTYHENIHIKRGKTIDVSPITGQMALRAVKRFMTGDESLPVGSELKEFYTFKHPSTVGCTEPGDCGFIVRSSKKTENTWISELSTKSEEYEGTGVHLHDIISASDMYWYRIWSVNAAPDHEIQVAGKWFWWEAWLPDVIVTDWVYKQECVAYNISDYVVTKQD